MATEAQNTRVSYMYRDGSNYKVGRDEVLAGLLTADQKQRIRNALDEDTWFVPGQVQLDHLHEELQSHDSTDENVDHPFHELVDIEDTSEPVTMAMTASQLREEFKGVAERSGWDEECFVGHVLDED